jgi:hypothetical protein
VAVVFNAVKLPKVEYIETTPELIPGKWFVPPSSPHATTLPSLFSAAKAVLVEYTATTPEFASVTLLGAVPPCVEDPHATTLPSVFSAAKA